MEFQFQVKPKITVYSILLGYSIVTFLFRDKLGETGWLIGYMLLMLPSILTAITESARMCSILIVPILPRCLMTILTCVVYLAVTVGLYVILPLIIYYSYNFVVDPYQRITRISTACILNLLVIGSTCLVRSAISVLKDEF